MRGGDQGGAADTAGKGDNTLSSVMSLGFLHLSVARCG